MSEQAVTLEQIQQTVPTARYAPRPACPRCGGKGVYSLPPEKAATFEYVRTDDIPCHCLFFAPKDDWAVDLLRQTARDMARELRGEQQQ